MEEQLVIFELNNELYGLDVGHVQTIIPLQTIVEVPNTPSFMAGVVNLRGAVIPVVDLRIRFNLSHPEEEMKAVVIIATLDDMQVGLVVDKVTEVVKIEQESIEPPSPLLVSVETAYLRGIGKLDERPIILLDLAQIFSPDEQLALAQTA